MKNRRLVQTVKQVICWNVSQLLQCNCVNQVNYISGAALQKASSGIGAVQYHGKQIGTVRVGGKKHNVVSALWICSNSHRGAQYCSLFIIL